MVLSFGPVLQDLSALPYMSADIVPRLCDLDHI